MQSTSLYLCYDGLFPLGILAVNYCSGFPLKSNSVAHKVKDFVWKPECFTEFSA